MKVAGVRSTEGETKRELELPSIFEEAYRPDLIKKAVLSYQSRRRQSYGADQKSGLKTSAHYEGSRHVDRSAQMMNREMSRMPREHGDTSRPMRGMLVPHAVGGRRAHPPKSEKKHAKKMNRKERKKAIRSAIAATSNTQAVKERNHKFEGDLPLVVEDEIETIQRTQELQGVLENLGLKEELKRTQDKVIRSGKGKMRGRKYRRSKSVLIVYDEDRGISKAGRNIPGVEAVKVENLNAELLSPGAHGARLTIYTESALKKLQERWGV